jgi:hypothetical protein
MPRDETTDQRAACETAAVWGENTSRFIKEQASESGMPTPARWEQAGVARTPSLGAIIIRLV